MKSRKIIEKKNRSIVNWHLLFRTQKQWIKTNISQTIVITNPMSILHITTCRRIVREGIWKSCVDNMSSFRPLRWNGGTWVGKQYLSAAYSHRRQSKTTRRHRAYRLDRLLANIFSLDRVLRYVYVYASVGCGLRVFHRRKANRN